MLGNKLVVGHVGVSTNYGEWLRPKSLSLCASSYCLQENCTQTAAGEYVYFALYVRIVSHLRSTEIKRMVVLDDAAFLGYISVVFSKKCALRKGIRHV